MNKRKPMVVNKHTYGYYYPETSTFECTHGAWSGKLTFIDDNTCTIDVVRGISTYKFIDAIPEGYC